MSTLAARMLAWGVTGLGRAGRHRKRRARYPSGRIKPDEKKPDDRIRASRQPHRRNLPPDVRLSEKAESPLGRLNLRGAITDEQLEGGRLYAVIVGQYRSVIEAPRSTAGSGRGSGCVENCSLLANPFGDGLVRCTCLEARRRYDAAFEAVAKVGRRPLMEVNLVAVQGAELPPEHLVYLDVGLTALARHFGLTGRREPRDCQNTH